MIISLPVIPYYTPFLNFSIICNISYFCYAHHMNIITVAEERDFEGIYQLVCQLEETEFDQEAMYEVFQHVISDHTVFISKDYDRITGYLVLSITYQMHHCGKVAEVVELCVSNSFQNRKIGTDLLNHAITCAKLHGCVNMDITTNQKRKDAHRLYSRNGLNNTHYKFTRQL